VFTVVRADREHNLVLGQDREYWRSSHHHQASDHFKEVTVSVPGSTRSLNRSISLALLVSLTLVLIAGGGLLFTQVHGTSAAPAAGNLTVTIVASPNLIVDSNVLTPPSWQPEVATVMGRICNTGGTAIPDVQAYIGNYTGTGATGGTPGVYPTVDCTGTCIPNTTPYLNSTGMYSLTHFGGSQGVKDATRWIGSLAGGACVNEYWSFSYPKTNNGTPTVATYGPSPFSNIADDLKLDFDIWAASTTAGGSNDNQTFSVNMRNEISAFANKVKPNPDGVWDTVPAIPSGGFTPGQTFVLRGSLYELGVAEQGFDVMNAAGTQTPDGQDDYSAWLQPYGNRNFDPSCYRLINATGVLTISRSSNPTLIAPFTNQLYFNQYTYANRQPVAIPLDNNGTRGNIYYTFMSLGGTCNSVAQPYQEVASGEDNEKFNGDYGTGTGINTGKPKLVISKSANPTIVSAGGSIAYSTQITNTGSVAAGDPTLGVPVVISDTTPPNTTFNSASFTSGTGTIIYSVNNGATWSATAPASGTANVWVQWWLNAPLAPGASATVALNVTVVGSPTAIFVKNCAGIYIDQGPEIAESCAYSLIQSTGTIGDFVWRDEDSDGQQDANPPESGIQGVRVTLYYDANHNGLFDSGTDAFIASQDTTNSSTFPNYLFNNLPVNNVNADYLVIVNDLDSNIPTGYTLTTTKIHIITDLGLSPESANPYLKADFGFGPIFQVTKSQSPANPILADDLVTYTLTLRNIRLGDGTGAPRPCVYYVWSTVGGPDNAPPPNTNIDHSQVGPEWTGGPSAYLGAGGPDGVYASSIVNGANEDSATSSVFVTRGDERGRITKVEAIYKVYVDATSAGDSLTGRLFYYNDTIDNATHNFTLAEINAHVGLANAGYVVWDVTNNGPVTNPLFGRNYWDWQDFAPTANTDLVLDGLEGGNPDRTMYLDALGFRITSDKNCGGSIDTIVHLPITDTYDASKLQFVSAVPTPTSVSSGVIYWNEMGPLYGGGSKQITVVMRALQPSGDPTGGVDAPNQVCNGTNPVSSDVGTTFDGAVINKDCDTIITHINPSGYVGDTVWRDNATTNGVQDVGELGIPGVKMEINYPTGCTTGVNCRTQTTNSVGYYVFKGLPGGAYIVKVLSGLPFGATQTGDPDNGPGPCGSPNPCDGQGASATLVMGDNNPTNNFDDTVDFGYIAPNRIYGNVYEDNNLSGTPDSGENGIPSVTVRLCANTACGTVISTTVTNASGDYLFSNLANGTYYVVVSSGTLPSLSNGTWTQTDDPDNSGVCTGGSNGGCDNMTTIAIVAAGGNDYGPYIFGYHRGGTLSIGDTVYDDWNGDGTQQANEPGRPNVTLYLYQDDNANGVIDAGTDGLIASTTTGGSGLYLFGGLAGGSYIVLIDRSDPDLPSIYRQTQDPDEAGTCTVCNNNGKTTLTTTSDLTRDFGYRPTGAAQIGDIVWRDDNADAFQDTSEPGLNNIDVTLYRDLNGNQTLDASDPTVGTKSTAHDTFSNRDGYYLFTELPAGEYLVVVNTADTSLPNDGYGKPYVLSTNNNPLAHTLTSTEVYLDADFGFTAGGVIGDTVWKDLNVNAAFDNNVSPNTEIGVGNVTVWLYVDNNGNGVVDGGDTLYGATTTANTASTNFWVGRYLFTGLPRNNYVAKVDKTDSDLSAIPTETADPTETGLCTTCDGENGSKLAAGQIDLGEDFGFIAVDFGDLDPLYFNTLKANSGARHSTGSLFLGASVDGEADGQPSTLADGDDLAGTDDENGVVPKASWSVAGGGFVTVTVTGGPGYLSGWADWNNDKDFADPGEKIISGTLVNTGAQLVTFPIPAGTTFPNSFNLRFRLYASNTSTTAPVDLTAGAVNGEVEDYHWPFSPTAISVSNASVNTTNNSWLLVLAGALLALAGAGIWLKRRAHVTQKQ
jgi:uncharacterized repeat protein (TIGR01451 family)